LPITGPVAAGKSARDSQLTQAVKVEDNGRTLSVTSWTGAPRNWPT